MADTTEATFSEVHLRAAARSSAFGNNHDAERTTIRLAMEHLVCNHLNIEGNLGDQDDVGTASQTSMESNPAGVAPHDFKDHHAVVARCRCMQAVNSICCYLERCIKAEGTIGTGEIVVDRLWHTNNRSTELIEFKGDTLRTFTTNRNQRSQTKLTHGLYCLQVGIILRRSSRLTGTEVALVRRAENRATSGEQSLDISIGQHSIGLAPE